MSVFNLDLPIAVGADHAGFDYKTAILEFLASKGLATTDFGTRDMSSVDYPDFAHPVALAVESGAAAFGVLICGSANGVAISANKHQGIRAGISYNNEVAKLLRQHNDANVICFPARFVALPYVLQMLETFIDTPFEGGRHQTRVGKVSC